MARKSLFNILSRQPWWVSAIAASVLFGITELLYPPVAFFVALPFLVVAAYVGYRQVRGTAPVNVDAKLAALRDMSWENFSLVVAEAYRRRGYAVTEAKDSAYDFVLEKAGRKSLVSCRRWKASSVGAGPLQSLAEAVAREDAYNAICLSAGQFSPNARKFVAAQPLTLLEGAELVALIGVVARRKSLI